MSFESMTCVSPYQYPGIQRQIMAVKQLPDGFPPIHIVESVSDDYNF